MLRLLIVDDEEQIVDWLYELFKTSSRYELDVFKAYSGSEALEWLNRTPIDIVLSDMCMPGIDGLELLKRIKERWPWCRVIFLTGHDDFDLIYEAVKYEDVVYLLKSESDAVITEAVENAAKSAEEELKKLRQLEHAKLQVKSVLPLMQKEYFSDLLDGVSTVAQDSQGTLDELEIALSADTGLMLLLGKLDQETVEGFRALPGLHHRINASFQSRLPKGVRQACLIHERTYFVWLLQPTESYNHAGLFASHIKAAVEHTQSYAREALKVSLSFSMTDDLFLWDRLSEKYEALKKLLSLRIGNGREMILAEGFSTPDAQDPAFETVTPVHSLSVAKKKVPTLERYLESGQKSEFMPVFEELLTNLESVKERNNFSAIELFYSISIMLLSYINKMGLAPELSFKVGLYKLFRHEEFNSWDEAAAFLRDMGNLLFDVLQSGQGTRAEQTVSRLKSYIKENIHTDLSLYSLGDYVHFNPVYLSRLFKQITGQNLSEYIAAERVSKAKELLERSERKIHEIALEVGCSSSNYFVRMFKKETGITPQEYRTRQQEVKN